MRSKLADFNSIIAKGDDGPVIDTFTSVKFQFENGYEILLCHINSESFKIDVNQQTEYNGLGMSFKFRAIEFEDMYYDNFKVVYLISLMQKRGWHEHLEVI